jgi:hypothetical protein
MKPNLPKDPDPRLIESMCLRYDHSHGIRSMVVRNGKFEEETVEEHEHRQDYNRRVMRQLYEEVSGYGFYNYPKDENE